MRTNFVMLGFALAAMSSALPTEDAGLYDFLSKRDVSPDNTCGNVYAGANRSYSCDATLNSGGGWCSQYGYCGNTTGYCGANCQPALGTCSPNTAPGGTCGPSNGGAMCSDNQCCSMSGFCGTTQDYCADPGSCMLGYGRCDSDVTPAGPSTQNVPRPLKGPITYTDDIYDCVENNVVALSYDDGPYNYTAQLLDLLRRYNFHATFFVTGNNNGNGGIDLTAPYPNLIKRMIAEGHQVASHTWSHYSLSNITHDLRISQMVKNEMAFNNIIGMWPTYMRPPYSDCTEASGCWADMQSLGYHRVYFDLDTQDYLNPSPNQIQNSKNIVQEALAAQNVVDYLSIQHDIVQQSVANLSTYYFDLIQQKGWKGVTVGECLGDNDRANWYRSFNESTFTTSSVLPSSTRASSSTSISGSVATSTHTTSNIPVSTSKIPTTTSKSSTPTPAPTPTCEASNGNWCGKVGTFTSKLGCLKAQSACFAGTMKCVAARWSNLSGCTKWNGICLKLVGYCAKCGFGECDNKTFGY